jgi:hypothetical protein
LDSAYRIRSRYVHRLKSLPGMLLTPDHRFEVMEDDGQPVLTFNGLARLVRHAILTFVKRQPAGEDPEFDYRGALPNIVRVRMAARYWIWKAEGLSAQTARRFLSAHFDEVGWVLMRAADAVITDIPLVLSKIEELVPSLAKPSQRIPLIVLYASFHECAPAANRRPNSQEFITRYSEDLTSPSMESLFLHVFTEREPPWPLDDCEGIRRSYFDQKFSKDGLNVGSAFETMITLWIAEKCRAVGDETRARELLSFCVENHPAHAALRAFEVQCAASAPLPSIDWRLLLSGNPSVGAGASDDSVPNDKPRLA